jgi:hypothetical protein
VLLDPIDALWRGVAAIPELARRTRSKLNQELAVRPARRCANHACRDYLDWLRWRDGWRCPLCVSHDGWLLAKGRRECARCGRQTSVTAGTIFHHARSPLTVWFAAAWLMSSQKYGVSALGLERPLGLGSYQTAWAMLHRYRKAMVRPGRERLHGNVEVDEVYVGGDEQGVRGRQTDTNAIVAIAVGSSTQRASDACVCSMFRTSARTA